MHNIPYRLSLCLLAISISLGACGKLGEKKDASQVAAKVNGAEISVHQIDQVLAQTPGVNEKNVGNARNEILERLVMQELVVAKATEAKLDRTPDIIMALEAARRDILARAYISQVAGAAPKATEVEAKRYYTEHPELFAQRRVYSMMDIAMPRDEKLIAPLQDMIARNKSMQAISLWLKERGIKFNADAQTRAAEQLPMEVLPRIAKLKDGQTEIIEVGPAMHIINLAQSRLEPVDMATAVPKIQQYISTQRGQQLVSDEFKKIREAAKVEYQGDFAAAKSEATPVAAPELASKPAAAYKPGSSENESIAKGAAGLK